MLIKNFLQCTSTIVAISYKNEPMDICNETSQLFCLVIKEKRTERVYNKNEFT